MPIMTLTTNFGTRDGYVGVMTGVIWGIGPKTIITDSCRLVTAQGTQLAAFLVDRVPAYSSTEHQNWR